MPKPRDLEFTPYVGRFFQFASRIREKPAKAIVGRVLYANALKSLVNFNEETLPKSILVLEEKRNHVRFISGDEDILWVPKTQIVPLKLPTYEGNPVNLLRDLRSFLVYCTDTKLKDFNTDEMVQKAMDLLPQLDALIKQQEINILPKK